MTPLRKALAALVVVLSALSALVLVTRVRLSPDVSSLLPDRGEAASLARYAQAFGGGDPGLVLVEGASADVVAAAAADAAGSIHGQHVLSARDRLALPHADLTPSQWLLLAGPAEQAALARLLTPGGMRSRLRETRALLLAPGGSALSASLARDPLRIGQLVAAAAAPGQAGPVGPDGAVVSDDGRAKLVTVEPRGNALTSADARGFVDEVEGSLGGVRARHPGATLRLTGGHALAAATERMLRRDLALSSALSLLLSSAVFLALFRRARALLAILPPLAAGTLVAASVAALFPHGISGIAVAFASVVIGVGMDTGVHVYAAVREAVGAGLGDPVGVALRRTARPVLGAAGVAASAFACLAFSQIEALRQLGILSAVGELSTALAILALTPAIAVRLERRARGGAGARASGGASGAPAPPAWTAPLARIASWRGARPAAAFACGAALLAAALAGAPTTSAGLLAIRPAGLAPNEVYEAMSRRFGTAERAPWVVLVEAPDMALAEARADALRDGLAARPDVVGAVDALTPWAPSEATLAARLAWRASLDLPSRARELEAALGDVEFAPARFLEATADLERPAPPPDGARTRALLGGRYEARAGGRALVALYVQADDEAALERLVAAIDPAASVTGYPKLEPSLRRALSHDLPRVGAAALALSALALAFALRRLRDAALALVVVATEIALVLLAMRSLAVPLHVFDALVLPVLLGITLDEVLFVMMAARTRPGSAGDAGESGEAGESGDAGEAGRAALRHEAPLVATTACTTAAGFGALLVCRFEPLRHLGLVGAVGSLTGLALALLVVPAWALGGPRGARAVSKK
jgi:uncharacterized protein